MEHLPEPLEITIEQASTLFNKGIVIYFHCSNNTPDSAFNTFTMRNDCKDASLNMNLYGRKPSEISFDEYHRWLQSMQAEPIRLLTLYSTELLALPLRLTDEG